MDLETIKADQETPSAEISTSIDKWRFLVRPEEGIGEGTLHYASLSAVLSAISSVAGGCECDLEQVLTSGTKIARWTPDGQNWTDIYAPSDGGGGGCSCDLSVTLASTLSSLGQDLVQIADWTNDGWQTHVPILAPDTAKDIITMANRLAYTPFYLRIRYNNGSPIMDIINNFFFYGRDMKTLQNYAVT